MQSTMRAIFYLRCVFGRLFLSLSLSLSLLLLLLLRILLHRLPPPGRSVGRGSFVGACIVVCATHMARCWSRQLLSGIQKWATTEQSSMASLSLSLCRSVPGHRSAGYMPACPLQREQTSSGWRQQQRKKITAINPIASRLLFTHTHTRSGPHLRAGAHIKCREILRKRHTCPNGQRYSPGLFSFMDLLASACNGIHTPCYDREKGRWFRCPFRDGRPIKIFSASA